MKETGPDGWLTEILRDPGSLCLRSLWICREEDGELQASPRELSVREVASGAQLTGLHRTMLVLLGWLRKRLSGFVG